MRLQDSIAIVTGGGKGIGRHYAYGLAREGAAVIIAEIDGAAAEETAAAIRAEGGKALAVPTDVSDEESVRQLVARTIEEYGRIDVLVNNAAIFASIRYTPGPFESIKVADWDRMFEVNVRGTWLCCKEVIPHMRRQGYGKIINISSGTASKGTPNALSYLTSKAAVEGLTRGIAREVSGPGGISVNCIAPGSTESETRLPLMNEQAKQAALGDRIVQRAQVSEDLVGTVVFLASHDSDFMTGQVLHVDGGSVLGK